MPSAWVVQLKAEGVVAMQRSGKTIVWAVFLSALILVLLNGIPGIPDDVPSCITYVSGSEAGALCTNQTGQEITGFHISFSAPASLGKLTAVGGQYADVPSSDISAREFTISRGFLAAGGSVEFTWRPPDARLEGLEWFYKPPDRLNVLHISAINEDELLRVLMIAGIEERINVVPVSLRTFNTGLPKDFGKYDVIVFGINDAYEGVIGEPIGRPPELHDYVEAGGGIIWTHDTLECGTRYGPLVEEPAGIEIVEDCSDPPRRRSGGFITMIWEDHPLLHSPFEIGHVGDRIPIQFTHTNGAVATTALSIIRYVGERAEPYNFYLLTNTFGAGRVVLTEMGDSFYPTNRGRTSISWPDEKESQILANAIFWASGQHLGEGDTP